MHTLYVSTSKPCWRRVCTPPSACCSLEAEVARLELHMEAMRVADQSNAQRLWYNRRVLVERASDNAATLTQQTRKLTRQRDALAELKA